MRLSGVLTVPTVPMEKIGGNPRRTDHGQMLRGCPLQPQRTRAEMLASHQKVAPRRAINPR